MFDQFSSESAMDELRQITESVSPKHTFSRPTPPVSRSQKFCRLNSLPIPKMNFDSPIKTPIVDYLDTPTLITPTLTTPNPSTTTTNSSTSSAFAFDSPSLRHHQQQPVQHPGSLVDEDSLDSGVGSMCGEPADLERFRNNDFKHFGQFNKFNQPLFLSPDLASPLLPHSMTAGGDDDDLASPLQLSSLPSSPTSGHHHHHHRLHHFDDPVNSPMLSSPLRKMTFKTSACGGESLLISRRNRREDCERQPLGVSSHQRYASTRVLRTSDTANLSPVFPDNAQTTPTGQHGIRRPVKRKIAVSCDDHLTPTRKVSVRSSPFKRHSNSLHRFNSEVIVKSAMNKGEEHQNLIGDFSRELSLPVEAKCAKNNDLHSISPQTLMKLMKGDYSHMISNYIIVDCRYPFEYNAGHIKGALNLHSKQSVSEQLVNGPLNSHADSSSSSTACSGRTVVIFHCEFSSERGPKMSRFLRNKDRDMNAENYPHLKYPEVYLLKDGYKAFYENDTSFCEPKVYLPMLDADHKEDLRRYRSQRQTQKRSRLRF